MYVDRARHVGGDLVEVVEAHERAGRVEVVAPGEALDVLDVVEELVREAERVLDAHRVADALGEALGAALDAAAELGVEGHGPVERPPGCAPGRLNAATAATGPLRSTRLWWMNSSKRAQVDGVVVLLGHDEAEHVDVERRARRRGR